MDTEQLNKFMKFVPGFVGVYPRDRLPRGVRKRPFGMIANTHTSNGPGQHWVAFFVDEDGIGEYFDSFGLPPLHDEFNDFLFENAPNGHLYNNVTLQCTSCVTCGHYCILFLWTRLRGKSIIDFFNLFTNNPNTNDVLIRTY